jgi:K+-transporting ATPase KdpF subunit
VNAPEGAGTMFENILLLVICAALMVYLVYAMLRPEKF